MEPGKKIPFDIAEIGDLKYAEFYLLAESRTQRERAERELAEFRRSRSLQKRLASYFRGVAHKLRGGKTHNYDDYDGSLIQVTERGDRVIEGCLWPSPKISLTDGTPMVDFVNQERIFEEFWYYPTEVSVTDSRGIMLTGRALRFEDSGEAEPLDVLVHVNKIPEELYFVGMAKLG